MNPGSVTYLWSDPEQLSGAGGLRECTKAALPAHNKSPHQNMQLYIFSLLRARHWQQDLSLHIVLKGIIALKAHDRSAVRLKVFNNCRQYMIGFCLSGFSSY